MDRYNALSDTTMDTLCERLEELLDEKATRGYDIEYSVRASLGRDDSVLADTFLRAGY
jgi:hypothetical protein